MTSRSYTLDATTGRVRATMTNPTLSVEELLSGQESLPLGTAFEVEETVTIRTTLLTPSLIDVDLQYYAPQFKIGNWELQQEVPRAGGGTDVEYGKADGQVGYIRSFNQRIVSTRILSLRGKLLNEPLVQSRGEVDDCNFYLKPILTPPSSFPGVTLGLAASTGVFKTRNFFQEIPTASQLLDTRYSVVLMYLFPGVELDSVSYEARETGLIFADSPNPSTTTCTTANTCDVEFDAFIRSVNFGQPLDALVPSLGFIPLHSTQAGCTATNGFACPRSTYRCSNGTIREYFSVVAT